MNVYDRHTLCIPCLLEGNNLHPAVFQYVSMGVCTYVSTDSSQPVASTYRSSQAPQHVQQRGSEPLDLQARRPRCYAMCRQSLPNAW